MKHVIVDYHFIRDQVQFDLLLVAHVSSAYQLTNILTKPLPTFQFLLLRDKKGLNSHEMVWHMYLLERSMLHEMYLLK